jgi:hypothetical protein
MIVKKYWLVALACVIVFPLLTKIMMLFSSAN